MLDCSESEYVMLTDTVVNDGQLLRGTVPHVSDILNISEGKGCGDNVNILGCLGVAKGGMYKNDVSNIVLCSPTQSRITSPSMSRRTGSVLGRVSPSSWRGIIFRGGFFSKVILHQWH